MNIHELKNEYTLWYHNPNDTNWSQDSYHQILTFYQLTRILDIGLLYWSTNDRRWYVFCYERRCITHLGN